MRPIVVVRPLLVLLLAWLWLLPAGAAAFPLENCTLSMTSLAANGSTVDSARSGDGSASEADPFIVDWDGTVSWQGTTSVSLKNNSYQVAVFGIPTPIRGTNDNGDDNRSGEGSVGVGSNAPFRITGLYYVSGSITGSGGTCTGSGVFKLAGDPVGTVPFFLGLVLLVLGALGLVGGLRGSLLLGTIGGLLLGLGAAVMLIIFSALLVGQATPFVAVLAGLVVGILLSLVGRGLNRSAAPA